MEHFTILNNISLLKNLFMVQKEYHFFFTSLSNCSLNIYAFFYFHSTWNRGKCIYGAFKLHVHWKVDISWANSFARHLNGCWQIWGYLVHEALQPVAQKPAYDHRIYTALHRPSLLYFISSWGPACNGGSQEFIANKYKDFYKLVIPNWWSNVIFFHAKM